MSTIRAGIGGQAQEREDGSLNRCRFSIDVVTVVVAFSPSCNNPSPDNQVVANACVESPLSPPVHVELATTGGRTILSASAKHSSRVLELMYDVLLQGTLYLNKHGFEERASIVPLHDDSAGVIVAEKCCDKCFARWPVSDIATIPAYEEYCRQALDMYQGYDFVDLMNSTFGLLPAGASPGTHRLAEVRSRTCICFHVAPRQRDNLLEGAFAGRGQGTGSEWWGFIGVLCSN